MLEIATERRLSDRRSGRGGGRRTTDGPAHPSQLRMCPACRKPGLASSVGESDGGWWFVCSACDRLWDQRQASGDDLDEVARAHVAERFRRVLAPSFWRRLAFKRDTPVTPF